MSEVETESKSKSKSKKPRVLKDRLQEHIAEYGRLALVIFVSLGILSLTGFYIAIKAGIDVGSTSGTTGALAAAWFANKLTMPIRIGATLVLTPILAKVLRRPPKSASQTPPAS
ncbi:MAG: FAM210 family protein [Myxococcales bacterium]|nr:FAM210 family protein [Myxococcales bacterium]